MKKRVLTLIAAVIAIILCSALFIACSNADPGEEENPDHRHRYKVTVIDPTCIEQGYTLYKCYCGDEYKDTYVNALGHNYVNGVCTRCNKQEGVDPVDPEDPVDPDHEHSYTATVIDPTCTEQGYTLHKCTCNDEYKDTYTNALNHSFTNYISDNNATCSKDCTKTAVCDRNGCDAKDTVDIPDSKNNIHTDNGNGVCSDCGQTIVYSDGLSFELNYDKESYYVKGIGDCEDTEISIPAFYNGLPITIIGSEAFRDCTGLASITIPNSVTSIGDSAFSGCSGLTGITIPNSVTSIGIRAFRDCTKLTSITIPNSVTNIVSGAFSGCRGLTSITVGSGNTKYNSAGNCIIETQSRTLIIGCKSSVIPTDGSVTSIGSSAFSGCTGLTSITIPDSVTSIDYDAFYNCTGLTSITIPNSVTSIGNYAFSGCTGLTSITIGNSVTSIGYRVFSGCTGLTSITIPNSVTSIGYYAFEGCSGLTSITIPDSVTSIDNYAFEDCDNMENVYYTGNIASWCSISGLSSIMFYGKSDKNLYINGSKIEGDLTIPNSVTNIVSGAFSGCNNIENIYYTGNIASWCSISGLSNIMFYGKSDKNLYINGSKIEGDLTIPNSVTSIVSYAFCNCTGLTSITIPNSVTSIGNSAFRGCTGLTSIEIPFVGSTKDGTSNTHFGYIFGASGYSDNSSKVPSSLKTVTITGGSSIGGGAFYKCTGLTSVTIGNSVTSIGESAFYNCTGLTSITIGNSVTSIGERAFYGCTGLTSVTIPNSVKSIGDSAFYNCTKLTSITIPNSVKSIGEAAFSYCTGLTSVTIGNSVTSIGEDAFEGCTGLTSVTIGNSVTSIGEDAFEGCYKLVEVYNRSKLNITKGSLGYGAIGENAKNIYTQTSGESKLHNINDYIFYIDGSERYLVGYTGNDTELILPNNYNGQSYEIYKYAFYNCTGLTSITIPNSITIIGGSAFSGCSNIENIYYTGDIVSWCRMFGLSGIMSYGKSDRNLYINGSKIEGDLIIPSSVTSISSSAFRDCTGLTSITIPNSVMSIGESAFRDCTGLTSVTMGNSVKSIGDYAFSNCTGLTSITIPNSVKSIDWGAFDDCTGLTSITIPNSVTSIGSNAFKNCYKLVEVYNLSDITITKGSSDNGYVGYYAKDIYTDINAPSKLSTTNNGFIIYNGGENDRYLMGYTGTQTDITLPQNIGGYNYEIYQYAFYGCKGLTSITIPNSVTSIGNYAFSYCTGLTSVTIPNSVTSIGKCAFYGCTGLTSITIGNSVTSIGNYAFSYCTGLTSITIPDSVTSIGGSAFSYCTGLTSITIPDSVTIIGSSAFRDCTKLTSITIPNNVTSIGSSAFSYCSGLNKVYYKGTESDWNGISIGSSNSPLTSATRYYYSETQPSGTGNYWHYDTDGVTPVAW